MAGKPEWHCASRASLPALFPGICAVGAFVEAENTDPLLHSPVISTTFALFPLPAWG